MNRLKVDGMHFFDEEGHQIILNGINLVLRKSITVIWSQTLMICSTSMREKDLIWFDWGSFGMELSRNQVAMMKHI